MTKAYVFDLLVNNLDDHIGLVAYSFYKYEKADLARSMRVAGNSEEEIAAATDSHHDNVSASHHLREKFREQSKTFFSLNDDQIIAEVSQFYEVKHREEIADLENQMVARSWEYEKQINILKRQHDAKIKKLEREHTKTKEKKIKEQDQIRDEWLAKVNAQKDEQWGKSKRIGYWMLSGVPGAIATLVLTFAVMSIVLMVKTTPEEKRAILMKSATDFVDAVAPQNEEKKATQ